MTVYHVDKYYGDDEKSYYDYFPYSLTGTLKNYFGNNSYYPWYYRYTGFLKWITHIRLSERGARKLAAHLSQKEKVKKQIYTHDEAMLLIEMFENILIRYNISVPSPEDDDRDPDDYLGLYGSTYSDLLDTVEIRLISLLNRHTPSSQIIAGKFSGAV